MKCFVLNLNRSPERYAAFQADWKAPFPCERFEAIDGQKLRLPQNWQHGPGGYGLNATYILLFSLVMRAGDSEPFAVFEDDALLVDRWWEDVPHSAPPNWYSINLGPDGGDARYRNPVAVADKLARLHHAWRTHAVVYNPERLPDLIALLGMFPFTVDQIWCKLMVEHDCRDFYCTRKMLAGARPGKSLVNGLEHQAFVGRFGLGDVVHEDLR